MYLVSSSDGMPNLLEAKTRRAGGGATATGDRGRVHNEWRRSASYSKFQIPSQYVPQAFEHGMPLMSTKYFRSKSSGGFRALILMD